MKDKAQDATTIAIPVMPSLDLGKVFTALGKTAEAIATTVTEAITTTTATVAVGVGYLISPGSGGGNNQNDTIQYKGGPKAADASTVTSSGQAATNKGEKVGGSGKAQGYSTRRNTRKGAREAAERQSNDGKARHDAHPADGRGAH